MKVAIETFRTSCAVRFAAIGIFVLFVENLCIIAFMRDGADYGLARGFSTLIAMVLSYVLNTKLAFRGAFGFRTALSYMVGVGFGVVVSYFSSLVLYYVFFRGSLPLVATNLGAAMAAVVNYVFQHFVTYRAWTLAKQDKMVEDVHHERADAKL